MRTFEIAGLFALALFGCSGGWTTPFDAPFANPSALAVNSDAAYVSIFAQGVYEVRPPNSISVVIAKGVVAACDDDALYGFDTSIALPSLVRFSKDGQTMTVLTNDAGFGELGPVALDASYVYWSTHSAINRIPKTGGAVEVVANIQAISGYVSALVVDDEDVYWYLPSVDTQGPLPYGDISRAPKAGGATTTLATSVNIASNLEVDETNLYWLARAAPPKTYDIVRFDKHTSTPAMVTVANEAFGSAIAVENHVVYWFQNGALVATSPDDTTTTVAPGTDLYPVELVVRSGMAYWITSTDVHIVAAH